MPELKIYTVKDLREWLENNHPAEGLSEQVIAPTRAWAIIHNPYVRDDDAIVSRMDNSLPILLHSRICWTDSVYGGHQHCTVIRSLQEEDMA